MSPEENLRHANKLPEGMRGYGEVGGLSAAPYAKYDQNGELQLQSRIFDLRGRERIIPTL
jgi:hypothetical protein